MNDVNSSSAERKVKGLHNPDEHISVSFSGNFKLRQKTQLAGQELHVFFGLPRLGMSRWSVTAGGTRVGTQVGLESLWLCLTAQ